MITRVKSWTVRYYFESTLVISIVVRTINKRLARLEANNRVFSLDPSLKIEIREASRVTVCITKK